MHGVGYRICDRTEKYKELDDKTKKRLSITYMPYQICFIYLTLLSFAWLFQFSIIYALAKTVVTVMMSLSIFAKISPFILRMSCLQM